jgi:hypothetical protein
MAWERRSMSPTHRWRPAKSRALVRGPPSPEAVRRKFKMQGTLRYRASPRAVIAG